MSVFLDPRYIAGLFDSDGSFSIIKHREPHYKRGYAYRVTAQIQWLDTDNAACVFESLKSKYGGCVYRYITRSSSFGPRRPTIKYIINGKRAAALITDILPHLRLKQRQARLCYPIAMAAQRGKYNKYHPRPSEEWDLIEQSRQEIMRLNDHIEVGVDVGR